jgi:hypothetical protein
MPKSRTIHHVQVCKTIPTVTTCRGHVWAVRQPPGPLGERSQTECPSLLYSVHASTKWRGSHTQHYSGHGYIVERTSQQRALETLKDVCSATCLRTLPECLLVLAAVKPIPSRHVMLTCYPSPQHYRRARTLKSLVVGEHLWRDSDVS